MNAFTPTPKLRNHHLQRQALIYIRQSTLLQVRDNTGSTARQYDLAHRARELGRPAHRITVIDQDQGRSGACSVGRDGFEQLIAEVGLGRAGAVFSLEASRLARSCSDWYRLLEIGTRRSSFSSTPFTNPSLPTAMLSVHSGCRIVPPS